MESTPDGDYELQPQPSGVVVRLLIAPSPTFRAAQQAYAIAMEEDKLD
jgi:hypothetical protein